MNLLKFHATWCGPCKALTSILKTVDPKVDNVFEIDVDKDIEMAAKYQVRGVPTLVLVDGDTEVDRTSGVKTGEMLRNWFTLNGIDTL